MLQRKMELVATSPYVRDQAARLGIVVYAMGPVAAPEGVRPGPAAERLGRPGLGLAVLLRLVKERWRA